MGHHLFQTEILFFAAGAVLYLADSMEEEEEAEHHPH